MCGFIGNVTDSPLVQALLERLGVTHLQSRLHNNPGTGPAASIDIVRMEDDDVQVSSAIWWLLLEASERGLKPSKYTSFNTRSDKLNTPRSAGYKAYREARCIIPATYIIEGEGAKGARRYHRIEPIRCAFALGGLYRRWLDPVSNAEQLSCSIITLPPHPLWQGIHSKSTPLFLPTDQPELVRRWLDPQLQDVSMFGALMRPWFNESMACTPIERPGLQRVLANPFAIPADVRG